MKILSVFISFFVSIQGVVIQCSFSTSNWGGSVGNIYFCSGTVTSSFNPTVITNIQGQHLSGKGNSDVLGFAIDGERNLRQFPTGLETFYPNLIFLNWSRGNLTTVTAGDLENFPRLRRIRFAFNQIESIESELFQHSLQLTLIELDNNSLRHVGYDLLINLSQLERANFLQNPCIDVEATNRLEIQELNVQLSQQCTPLITTTVAPTTTIPAPICDIRCSIDDEVDELRQEVTQLNQMNLELRISGLEQENIQKDQRIVQLEDQVEQQNGTNLRFETKILELERKLNNLLATP